MSSSDGNVEASARDDVIYGGSSLFDAHREADASIHRRKPRDASSAHHIRGMRSGAPPMESALSVMSVVEQGSHIAFCCYREEQNEIMIEHCQATGYETEALVERYLQVARPTMVLVGNRIVKNISLLQMVTKAPSPLPGEGRDNDYDDAQEGEAVAKQKEPGRRNEAMPSGAGEDDFGIQACSSSIPYCVLKSKSFDLRVCQALILHKLRVLSLLPKEGHDGTTHHRTTSIIPDPDRDRRHFPMASLDADVMYKASSFHHLAAVIDFDSKVLVQSLGALISHLQSRVFLLEEGGMVTVNRIVQASTSTYMKISSSTFSALHIFATEHHPLIANGHGHAKEGFSLYSLLDRTSSKGGRQLLREWMLKPLLNLETITTRQDTIECFLQPSFETAVGILNFHLKKIGPIDKILLRIQKCTTKPQDFVVLKTTLSAAIAIGQVLHHNVLSLIETRSLSTELCYGYLGALQVQCNLEALMSLRESILMIVDEESTLGSVVVIRHGFDEELDNWKEQYESLEEQLQVVASDLHQKHPSLSGLSVLFLAQVGYLVALNKELVFHSPIQLPPDFDRVFSQDEDVYFKCDEMRVLDEELGDLDGLIKDREKKILTELEETILDAEIELRESFKALSELDCILSFAECAADLCFTRPKMVEHSQEQGHHVYIKDGRHPLQEIFTETEFVPNDVRIDEQDRVLVVTGPNYSGKSCYLRQVGVLVYMAQLGSYIPASRALISITDQICARIATVETCSRPQSSYQLELTEMASILLTATTKSLVLIDEFGKGTNPASGIAVLGAALKKLSMKGCKTVCTTHFLELFTMNVIQDQQEGIRARRMTIHLPDGNADDAVPLFKLEDGVASSSAGLVCARNAGITHDVIDRAKEIIETIRAKRVIRPLPEALGYIIPQFSRTEEEMLLYFSSIDSWQNASKDHLRKLIQKVEDLASHSECI